jgi:hypothetical protein
MLRAPQSLSGRSRRPTRGSRRAAAPWLITILIFLSTDSTSSLGLLNPHLASASKGTWPAPAGAGSKGAVGRLLEVHRTEGERLAGPLQRALWALGANFDHDSRRLTADWLYSIRFVEALQVQGGEYHVILGIGSQAPSRRDGRGAEPLAVPWQYNPGKRWESGG